MPDHVHRKTCRLCHSPDIDLGVHFGLTPPGDVYVSQAERSLVQKEFPLDLYVCRVCGTVQLLDVIDPAILYNRYYIYQTSISLGLPEHFKQYVDDALALTKVKPASLVLDIGSNDGTLLKCFKEKGLKVLGIDPAAAAVKTANARGVETLQMMFNKTLGDKLRHERGAFALVTANNVMANIDDMVDLAQGIRALIEPDGFFIFETGYGLDLFKYNLIDGVYHEHLSYFSVEALEKFFRRQGMRMVHAQHIPTKGGSIRCVVVSEKSGFKTLDTVQQMINNEQKEGMGQKKLCDRLSAFIADRKEELNKFIDDLHAKGAPVAGYGASVGVTTLRYMFGIEKKIDFFVDDNPERFGLFTPGVHAPVYSSDVLYEKKPGCVIVFAWRYIEPILKRHQKFIEDGGKMAVFLPEWKVYSK